MSDYDNNKYLKIIDKDIKLDTFKLVNNMYLVLVEKPNKSLIISVNEFDEMPYRGKVIKVNYKMYNDKGIKKIPECKEGNFIYFGKLSGWPIDIEGVEYQLMNEDLIWLIIDEKTKIHPNF